MSDEGEEVVELSHSDIRSKRSRNNCESPNKAFGGYYSRNTINKSHRSQVDIRITRNGGQVNDSQKMGTASTG